MRLNTFWSKPESASVIVFVLQVAACFSEDFNYDDQEEPRGGLNLLTVSKTKTTTRRTRLSCWNPKAAHRPSRSFAMRHLLADDDGLPENTMYDEEKESESHDEICYRNKQFDKENPPNNEFNPNPPTMDPNLLPPTKPELKIKSNDSILVSWQALKRKQYPIDFFMVEFYQYNGTTFCSKCCTSFNNTPVKHPDDPHHEEIVDGMEPGFDYKFRVASVYPRLNFSWGPFAEPLHLPPDFEGDDDY